MLAEENANEASRTGSIEKTIYLTLMTSALAKQTRKKGIENIGS